MNVAYLHLSPGRPLPDTVEGPLLAILICEAAAPPEWRDAVCAWLVDSRCLYFVSWGQDCEEWHDRVDRENLERFDYEEIPDDRLIMTTWHANDPLHEALWFGCHCAEHPTVSFDRTLLVHVAESSDEARLRDAFDLALRDDCSDQPDL